MAAAIALATGVWPAAADTLVIVDRVEPVCSVQPAPPTKVLVAVVDDRGQPMAEADVELSGRGAGWQTFRRQTDQAGRAEFVLEQAGEGRVSSSAVGFHTSVARRVKVKRGCLIALTLPMQVARPKDIISTK
jgi:hypothetical protein